MGLWFCGFYVQEHPNAQPEVVLVLKRLRRQGHGLKSHQTDWEKPGIKPGTPGFKSALFIFFNDLLVLHSASGSKRPPIRF